MKSCCFIILVLLWHYKSKKSCENKKNVKHPNECHKIKDIHLISGLIFKREVSCDQNSGMEPRFWTTELICKGNPSGTSSKTICSVSTSLATLPFSFTPRFKYLNREAPVRGVPMWKLIKTTICTKQSNGHHQHSQQIVKQYPILSLFWRNIIDSN